MCFEHEQFRVGLQFCTYITIRHSPVRVNHLLTSRFLAVLQDQEYKFRLHEHSEYGWSPRLRARDFISLLSNLTAVKIRATYTTEGKR